MKGCYPWRTGLKSAGCIGGGAADKAILRVLGISRNTVRAAIASDVLTRTHPVATGRVLNC